MTIPKQAREIALYIRENVERPRLNDIFQSGAGLRIKLPTQLCAQRCPMGLLKVATHPRPFERSHFRWLPKGFTKKSIRAFGQWWDRQTDPQAAIDAIWNEE